MRLIVRLTVFRIRFYEPEILKYLILSNILSSGGSNPRFHHIP